MISDIYIISTNIICLCYCRANSVVIDYCLMAPLVSVSYLSDGNSECLSVRVKEGRSFHLRGSVFYIIYLGRDTQWYQVFLGVFLLQELILGVDYYVHLIREAFGRC